MKKVSSMSLSASVERAKVRYFEHRHAAKTRAGRVSATSSQWPFPLSNSLFVRSVFFPPSFQPFLTSHTDVGDSTTECVDPLQLICDSRISSIVRSLSIFPALRWQNTKAVRCVAKPRHCAYKATHTKKKNPSYEKPHVHFVQCVLSAVKESISCYLYAKFTLASWESEVAVSQFLYTKEHSAVVCAQTLVQASYRNRNAKFKYLQQPRSYKHMHDLGTYKSDKLEPAVIKQYKMVIYPMISNLFVTDDAL